MPLAKLQRFGEGRRTSEDRFIYDFSWREEASRQAVSRPGFDDTLNLRPGVGGWLVRLAPLIRPLVQAKWAARVAARNSDLVDSERLDEFLFGAQRISLQRIRGPLTEAQDRACFYCANHLSTRGAVDHFLPWSRHPDNTLDNLVAAHPACNNAKSASLASLPHLENWLARFRPADPASSVNAPGVAARAPARSVSSPHAEAVRSTRPSSHGSPSPGGVVLSRDSIPALAVADPPRRPTSPIVPPHPDRQSLAGPDIVPWLFSVRGGLGPHGPNRAECSLPRGHPARDRRSRCVFRPDDPRTSRGRPASNVAFVPGMASRAIRTTPPRTSVKSRCGLSHGVPSP
jgi:hypothetical protein